MNRMVFARASARKPDIQRRTERKPVQKVGLGEDKRSVVIEISRIFNNMRNTRRSSRDFLCIADFRVGLAINIKRDFKISVVVGRIRTPPGSSEVLCFYARAQSGPGGGVAELGYHDGGGTRCRPTPSSAGRGRPYWPASLCLSWSKSC